MPILILTGNRSSASRRAFWIALSRHPTITDPAFCHYSDPLPQIASADLDIAILSQLPTPDLALYDEFEAGSVEMIGFDTAFR